MSRLECACMRKEPRDSLDLPESVFDSTILVETHLSRKTFNSTAIDQNSTWLDF